jgi:hypothetical protein
MDDVNTFVFLFSSVVLLSSEIFHCSQTARLNYGNVGITTKIFGPKTVLYPLENAFSFVTAGRTTKYLFLRILRYIL